MDSTKYDIFISYRRRTTADKAEHLLSLLSEHGYKGRVSFDKDNFSGRFDLEILKRVDACKDFVIILGKDSLVGLNDQDTNKLLRLSVCSIEDFNMLEKGLISKDYVRIELARAIAKGKNIIPVVPQDTSDYSFSSLALPADIQDLTKYQAVYYSDQDNCFLFQDIVPKILKKLVSRPRSVPQPGRLSSWRVVLWPLITIVICGFLFLFFRDALYFKSLFSSREGMEQYLQSDRFPQFHTRKAQKILQDIATQEESIRSLPGFSDFHFSPGIDPVSAEVIHKILSTMRFIQGGSFMMGANPGGKAAMLGLYVSIKEQPAHPAAVEDFWMGKYEVSVDEWDGIMQQTRSQTIDFPVTGVSWKDAMSFCDRLYQLTGLPFGLPTEVMWEYAARAGGDDVFAGSDYPDEVAWFADREGAGERAHVRNDRKGGLRCNAFELYDMSGNVAEWCLDSYCSYNDEVPENIEVKVIRGGSITDPARKITVTYRDPLGAEEISEYVGFRLSMRKI